MVPLHCYIWNDLKASKRREALVNDDFVNVMSVIGAIKLRRPDLGKSVLCKKYHKTSSTPPCPREQEENDWVRRRGRLMELRPALHLTPCLSILIVCALACTHPPIHTCLTACSSLLISRWPVHLCPPSPPHPSISLSVPRLSACPL